MQTSNPNPTHRGKVEVRSADSRGTSRFGWLDSKHSFSFSQYHDPARMGFHGLRVLNDDRVAGGGGFPTHPHRDMEILTWVLAGRLGHRDSMGHASTLSPGQLQVMTAGSGVTHSEVNASDSEPVHFLQVWIEPTQRGTTPWYAEASPEPGDYAGRLLPLAAGGVSAGGQPAADPVIPLGADATVYVGRFAAGQSATLPLPAGRVAYIHVARGGAEVAGQTVTAGDAVTVADADAVTFAGHGQNEDPGEVLAFVLPA
jgi:redox-sensitive bicupin YhaK (pirin superfamily)